MALSELEQATWRLWTWLRNWNPLTAAGGIPESCRSALQQTAGIAAMKCLWGQSCTTLHCALTGKEAILDSNNSAAKNTEWSLNKEGEGTEHCTFMWLMLNLTHIYQGINHSGINRTPDNTFNATHRMHQSVKLNPKYMMGALVC